MPDLANPASQSGRHGVLVGGVDSADRKDQGLCSIGNGIVEPRQFFRSD